ncbi:MAG: hypothetical protein ACI39R_02780 [Lachnospiraceae bacterium]
MAVIYSFAKSEFQAKLFFLFTYRCSKKAARKAVMQVAVPNTMSMVLCRFRCKDAQMLAAIARRNKIPVCHPKKYTLKIQGAVMLQACPLARILRILLKYPCNRG